jgi:cadmium resistance protein CadD (predicted permease)
VSDPAGTAGAAAAAFAATNLDDVVVLTALFALAARGGPLRARHVVAGQVLGLGTLVAAAWVAAAGLLLVPEEVVGLLGLVPLALGILGLAALLRETAPDDEPAPIVGGTAGVAALTIAGGADNIAVYVPFFASQGASGAAVVVGTFAVLLAVWLLGARWLAGRPPVARLVGRWGHVAVPVVLIVLGVAILVQAGTLGSALDGVTG